MKRFFIFIFISFCSIIVAACGNDSLPQETIDDFTFIDQNNENFGTDDLHGHIWIADFIFTSCHTVCQPMTSEMALLQQKFKERGVDVQFVSFTVDPTIDTPKQLRKYIKNFTDDLSNWHLLTGYTQEDIESFAREQFKTIVQKHASSTQIIHGTNFYLIDHAGQIIGDYNYIDSTYYEKLLEDINMLLKE